MWLNSQNPWSLRNEKRLFFRWWLETVVLLINFNFYKEECNMSKFFFTLNILGIIWRAVMLHVCMCVLVLKNRCEFFSLFSHEIMKMRWWMKKKLKTCFKFFMSAKAHLSRKISSSSYFFLLLENPNCIFIMWSYTQSFTYRNVTYSVRHFITF